MPLRKSSRSLPKSRARSIRALSAFATTGLLFGAFAATGSAATITVANTNDTGPGSLRQAVADAASGDTISFGSGVEGTVTFTTGPIAIDKSLTITGSGPDNVILRGAGDRLFRIGANNGAIDVTFQGLRLSRGNAQADGGGGIYSSQDAGQTLTLQNTLFDRNVAAAQRVGGAVFLDDDASMVISGSRFTDNATEARGGAIGHYSLSPITITDSTFERNVTDSKGGAIALDKAGTPSGASLIDRTTFANNSGGADGDGGAIWMANTAPMTIRASQFTSNTSGDFNSGGAILHDSRSDLVVESTVFTANVATYGGAIESDAPSSTGALTIRGSLFQDNVGGKDGSALFRDDSGQVTISDTVFRGNSTGNNNAVVSFYNGTAVITNTAIVQNTGGDNSGAAGL